jgi:AraC-like DNA-binding protein
MITSLADLLSHSDARLLRTGPPYESWTPIDPAEAQRPDESPGAIFGLNAGLGRQPTTLKQLAPLAAHLMNLRPDVPVVLLVADSHAASVHVAREAGELGIAAVLGRNEDLSPTLRHELSRIEGVIHAAPRLLQTLFPAARPDARDLACQLLLGEFDAAVPTKATQGGSRLLRANGLPSTAALRRIGRALGALLDMQQHVSSSTLTQVAGRHGYYDQASLSRAFVRLFGARPSLVRKTIGWQGWLVRALVPQRPM